MYLRFAMTGASGLGTSAKGNIASVLAMSLLIHYQEVQHDQETTGSLELNEGRESLRGPKYRKTKLLAKQCHSQRKKRSNRDDLERRINEK